MVLESIIGEKRIRQNPVLILFITFFLTLASIYFADLLFPEHGSILSVAFVTIALVPIIHNILASEESEELLERKSSATFFARHFNVIMLYVWVFIGIILAFSVAYVVAPIDAKPVFFDEQITAFCSISGSASCNEGKPLSIAGRATASAMSVCQNPSSKNVFACTSFIYENNAGVLAFILALSVIYGAGAIFIIAWNASILGVFFGEMIMAGEHLRGFGFLQGMLIGHGPPELLAYVFAALAGAIISAAISKGDFLRHEGEIIIKDVLFLVGLAVFSVVYGAFVEAVGLMGWSDVYYIAGFVYILLVLAAVFFYGKKSKNYSAKFSY